MGLIYNAFKQYIQILTRINFTVELIPNDRFRRDHQMKLRNLKAMQDSEPVERADQADKSDKSFYCLECNMNRSSRNDSKHICRHYLQNNNNNSNKVETDKKELTPMHLSRINLHERSHSIASNMSHLKNKLMSRWHTIILNRMEYSYVHLSIYVVHVFVTVFMSVKLTLHASGWVLKDADDQNIICKPLDVDGKLQRVENEQLRSKSILYELIACDTFANFNNSRILNQVAIAYLLPYTITKLVSFFSLLSKILSKDHNNLEKEHNQEVNIVQINVAYLNSLHTSTAKWYKLFKRSWFHKHKLENFELETSILNQVKLYEGLSISELDLRSKIYFYNLISFNHCYVGYFGSNCGNNRTDKLIEEEEDLAASGRLIESEEGDEKKTQLQMLQHHEWHEPKKVRDKNIFVARPIHRMDLNEMAWLMFMLMVLYVLNVLSFGSSSILAILVQFGFKRIGQLSFGNLFEASVQAFECLTIIKCMHVIIWVLLIHLATFDLFNFFSCCLICHSRARYVQLHLERISQLCSLVINLNQNDECNWQSEVGNLDLGINFKEEVFKVNKEKSEDKEMVLRMTQINNINKRIEFLSDQALLVSRELHDIKKYFTTFINLEFAPKILVMAFLITALLEENNIFQIGFLLVTTNVSATPIIIVLTAAALIESKFRATCKEMNWIIAHGRDYITPKNMKSMMHQAEYLSVKSNRSFVMAGNFALSIGSLVPVIAWTATGVVLFRR